MLRHSAILVFLSLLGTACSEGLREAAMGNTTF